jgi:hypothetical protein
MRKMRILGLVLVCLLATAPVMAADMGEGGSWWDGVVGWVTGMAEWVIGDLGGGAGSDALGPVGSSPATSGLDKTEAETGVGMEPNG